jgi:hypothetical protein
VIVTAPRASIETQIAQRAARSRKSVTFFIAVSPLAA